jgi:hypothetical protein
MAAPDGQVGAMRSAHVPVVMAPQVPSLPAPFLAALHAWHVSVHAVSQQTPSTQFPEVH